MVEHCEPHIVVLTEVRSDLEGILKLNGFTDWLLKHKFYFSYFLWTGDKTKIGEGGVAIFSHIKPVQVQYGLASTCHNRSL